MLSTVCPASRESLVFPLVVLRPKEKFWERKVTLMASLDTDSQDTASSTSQGDTRVCVGSREAVMLLRETSL